jgi:DNA-binding MarR family transcriptional regulator
MREPKSSQGSAPAEAIESGGPADPRTGFSPDNWLAGEVGRTDPASEAWSLMHWLMISNKPRMVALGQEFDLPFQALIALRVLGAGPRPMGELAKIMLCDSSAMTGITDRLEERGLARREPAEGDRRVKLLVLTDEGDRLRTEITERLADPPPTIAALSSSDQRQLRDILRRAIDAGGAGPG